MLLSNARHTNQGFTLFEIIIVLAIVGILSAIAAPSFLSMLNRNKVNNALTQVRGALQEAQREAMRRSKQCTVTIDTTNKKITSPCLVTGERELCYSRNPLNSNCTQWVDIATNLEPSSITYSFRGTTTDQGKIVLYMSDGSTDQKKCLAISLGPGIMRTGKYSGSTSSASNISDGTCTTSQ